MRLGIIFLGDLTRRLTAKAASSLLEAETRIMKKYFQFALLIALSITFFTACSSNREANSNDSGHTAPEVHEGHTREFASDIEEDCVLDSGSEVRVTSFVGDIHPDLPRMRFDIAEHSYLYEFTDVNIEGVGYFITITISWYETGEVFQEINEIEFVDEHGVSVSGIISTMGVSGEYFVVEDLNFDGYMDIRFPFDVYQVHVFYNCWFFDVDTDQFVFRPDMFIPNMRVDAENQIISSSERVSGAPWITHYVFVDDFLTPIRLERLSTSGWMIGEGDGDFDVTYEWVDDDWVEVERLSAPFRG